MKVFSTIMKIVAALAAIAGIVYVVATYGDKIVAWAKKILRISEDYCCCDCCCDEEDCCCGEEDCCCDEECCCEEAPEVVEAEDKDFEG